MFLKVKERTRDGSVGDRIIGLHTELRCYGRGVSTKLYRCDESSLLRSHHRAIRLDVVPERILIKNKLIDFAVLVFKSKRGKCLKNAEEIFGDANIFQNETTSDTLHFIIHS